MSSKSPDKILIRMPNWLGDCVMALPVVESLKSRFPEAKTDIVMPAAYSSLVDLAPSVSRVFPLEDKRDPQRKATLQSAKDGGYDLLVVLPNSFRSAWELHTRKIPLRLGYAGGFRSFLLTDHPIRTAKHSLHQSDYYMQLLRHLYPDIKTAPAKLEIPQEARNKADGLLFDLGSPLIGIGFGATFGVAKMWPPERFAELLKRLSTWSTPVLLGGQAEVELADKVIELSGVDTLSLVGQTDLPTLAAIFEKLSVYITNDTGPMHLATALNTSITALFGPTSPDETKPTGQNLRVVYHKQECAPCWKRHCPKQHECMMAIGVDEVETVVTNLVNRM